MKTKKKRVLILALLAVIVSAAVFGVVGTRETPEKALLKTMSDRVDLQVKDVHYTEVDDAGTKWEIRADTARYQKKDNLAFFEKIAVRLVMKDGRVFTLTGDRGQVDSLSRDMEIEGNVGIVSENGDRFSTNRLQYKNAGKRIETDRPVTMENENVRISGVGMIFALAEKKVTILSQVRANTIGK